MSEAKYVDEIRVGPGRPQLSLAQIADLGRHLPSFAAASAALRERYGERATRMKFAYTVSVVAYEADLDE